jgi:hypothetical protein
MVSGTPDGSSSATPIRRSRAKLPDVLTRSEILLCHEFEQAWQHYRQNESLRSQYLGYFFALIVASAAFGTQTVRSRALSSPPSLVLFEIFLLALSLLSCFVYLGVRRAGIALTHYESVWNVIRDHFYSGVDRQAEPYRSLNIRASSHKVLRRRWTGMQALSEFVVMLLCMLDGILQIVLSARLFLVSATYWERAMGVGILVITFTVPISVIAAAGTSLRHGLNN